MSTQYSCCQPVAVDALAEVALAVQQADRGQRQRPVGGLLEDVAGQRAEAAGVDRQRAVHAVLGAEVGDRAVRRSSGRAAARRRGPPARRASSAPRARSSASSRRGAAARSASASCSSWTGFSAAALPAVGVDVGEQLGAARRPGPAVVVGEAGEHAQRLGHPRGELRRRAIQVALAGDHGPQDAKVRSGRRPGQGELPVEERGEALRLGLRGGADALAQPAERLDLDRDGAALRIVAPRGAATTYRRRRAAAARPPGAPRRAARRGRRRARSARRRPSGRAACRRAPPTACPASARRPRRVA